MVGTALVHTQGQVNLQFGALNPCLMHACRRLQLSDLLLATIDFGNKDVDLFVQLLRMDRRNESVFVGDVLVLSKTLRIG